MEGRNLVKEQLETYYAVLKSKLFTMSEGDYISVQFNIEYRALEMAIIYCTMLMLILIILLQANHISMMTTTRFPSNSLQN